MPRTAPSSRTFGRATSRVDSFEIISAAPRHPVVRVLALLIRLRAELFVLALCLTAWVALAPEHLPGPDGTPVAVPGTGLDPNTRIALFAAVVVLLAALPWTRRFLYQRAQAVITRHRVRQAFVECRVINYSRACPLTLWSRPTRVGEVVWVMLRAGIGPEAVATEAEEIASSCFAREARVTPWPSMTNIVRVEVIRRDPLAPSLIRSDLFRWAAGSSHADGWTDAGSPSGPSTVPAPRPSEPTRPNLGGAIPGPAQPAIEGQAGGRGGDWSDYV